MFVILTSSNTFYCLKGDDVLDVDDFDNEEMYGFSNIALVSFIYMCTQRNFDKIKSGIKQHKISSNLSTKQRRKMQVRTFVMWPLVK